MRVTDKMGYNQVTQNLQKNRGELSDLQNQAATQKRINKPSDDPVASARVLSNRTEDRSSQQFIKNINSARSFLEFTDVSLGELSEVLMRMKELAIQQASDAGASDQTRRVVAEEVQQAFNQIIQIGNRKLGERFVFGGNRTTKSPFDGEGNYLGDDGDLKIHVNKDAYVAMNLPGDKVFLGQGVDNDGLIRPRASTPKSAQEFIKFKEEERMRDEHNQNFQTESVRMRGPATVHAAQETFNSNVKGDKEGVNILSTIKNFEIALRTNEKSLIQDAIDDIDMALTQVVHARAQVGARIQVLNHTNDSLTKNIQENKVNSSQLEDADIFQVVSDMAKTDSALKATLETSGRIIQPSLLDFLK
ncbi:MAG: flagellar hook-associated protein FlgL [Oligoflexia bacterium]|nr:MAG: flagellar hook-associated protein FlgL [Oligoflexia bacterium]